MELLGSTFFWVTLGQIMMINIVLSGDNAVVIALASRSLPAKQQKMAVMLGSFGAIALRVILTFFAVLLRAVRLAAFFVAFLAAVFVAFFAAFLVAVFFAGFFVALLAVVLAADLRAVFRPEPESRPPPLCLLTVAQAIRSASFSDRPCSRSLSSMCSAWRFCLSV